MPAATVPTTLLIKIPNGNGGVKDYRVDNPLRIYKFPQAAINQQFGSFSRDPEVIKCRDGSYPASANQALGRRAYKTWIYDAFTRSTTFEQFASTSSTGTSLEQIHNAIHWDGSCGFQFLNADYSAFDPLFMLHHTTVDRFWAYWQFIKPNEATLTRSYRGQARFSTRSNTVINANSPLQPFYASAGRFHTPDSVKSIKNFGYTYEGLEYWRKNDAQLQRDATAYINRNYVVGSVRLRKRDGEDDTLTRYFAQISVDVTQLERPCAIELFANTTSVGNFIVMQQPETGTFSGSFSLDAAADPKELKDEKTSTVIDDLLASLRIEIKKVRAFSSSPWSKNPKANSLFTARRHRHPSRQGSQPQGPARERRRTPCRVDRGASRVHPRRAAYRAQEGSPGPWPRRQEAIERREKEKGKQIGSRRRRQRVHMILSSHDVSGA